MREINDLNKRLVKKPRSKRPSNALNDMLSFSRNEMGDLRFIAADQRPELRTLCASIGATMPNDFNYFLFLFPDAAEFQVIYQDGPQTTIGCNLLFDHRRSILKQLGEVDWQKLRSSRIRNASVFDQMIEHAKRVPAQLPSTAELHEKFRSQADAFVREHKRRKGSKIRVLLWGDMEGVHEREFKTDKDFLWQIPDLMAFQLLIIAIVRGGKPMTVREIEKLKANSLKELESMPVSHAKALWKISPPSFD